PGPGPRPPPTRPSRPSGPTAAARRASPPRRTADPRPASTRPPARPAARTPRPPPAKHPRTAPAPPKRPPDDSPPTLKLSLTAEGEGWNLVLHNDGTRVYQVKTPEGPLLV